MRIAYLHYHLKPGGVTSVIRHQVHAVRDDCETLILADTVPEMDMGTEVAPVPGLAYDTEQKISVSPRKLAESVLHSIYRKWPSGCDVLHIHNPTLVKNRQLVPAIEILRDQGCPLLLQIHDFAEDGRPHLFSEHEYPRDVSYGVVNSRDRDLLIEAGLKPEGVYLIENAVIPSEDRSDRGEGFVLYPVRAIRRKNIGECLLLSMLIDPELKIGITLPPHSKPDIEIFERWREFAKQHGLRVHFDVGIEMTFVDLMHDARFTITTSVNEGFGFAFLEPWTAGKMVHGRRLNHVCDDFERNGMNLNHLYEAILVPIHSFDAEAFNRIWKEAITVQADAFDYPIDPKCLESSFQRLMISDTIDFGILDETSQMQVLLHFIENPQSMNLICDANPWLDHLRFSPFDEDVIAHNDRIVRQIYSRKVYREKLLGIYESVQENIVKHGIRRDVLIKSFLDPLNFRIIG